jgi:hypothetical protein
MSNQLINVQLANQFRTLALPDSNNIDIQVRVWRTEGLPWPHHNGSALHPKDGGDIKGQCHFLGAYEGYLPTNEKAQQLLAELQGKSKEERDAILAQHLELLYVFYPHLNDGKGGVLPVLKGATLSFFSTWEDHQYIEGLMDKMGVNALTFRVTVPQVCTLFQGTAREATTRPLFSGTFYGISFLGAEEEGRVAEWRSSTTFTFPVILPPHVKALPELQYQQASIDVQQTKGAVAGLRNKRMLGKSELPTYMQGLNHPNIPTVGSTSMKVEPEGLLMDPVKASLS